MQWKTLLEMLYAQAERYPDGLYLRFVSRGRVTRTFTYEQTCVWAERWAGTLHARGVGGGDVVALALENGADFCGAYYGALLVGATPMPVPPAQRLSSDDPFVAQLAQRVRRVSVRAIVVSPEHADLLELGVFGGGNRLCTLSNCDVGEVSESPKRAWGKGGLGLLQFTSGTTGNGKAVQLTQEALLAQTKAIDAALALDRDVDWAVSWLPLYHDMGLIGFLLTPAYAAGSVTLMATRDFVLDPTLWMKTLSGFSASITGAPPSAYFLCARRHDRAKVEQYDLRRVRIALVGAEPVHRDALDEFVRVFAPAGFRRACLMPTYGMAENGLAVTMPPCGRGPKFDTVDRDALQRDGRAVSAERSRPRRDTRTFVSVGTPLAETEVRILDDERRPLGDRRIGEVAIRSPSVMVGYVRDAGATAEALRDGWFLSGDLGYLSEGELYLVGRKKELLIVGGRKYDPHDLEEIAGRVEGIYRRRVIAISHYDPERATESVVVLAETRLGEDRARNALRLRVRRSLTAAGYPVTDIVLLRPKTIRTTPNGKLKRAECHARYLAGELCGDGRHAGMAGDAAPRSAERVETRLRSRR